MMYFVSLKSTRNGFIYILLLISSCGLNNGEENFKLCKGKDNIIKKAGPLVLKITKEKCQGCKSLENCTTYEGSIQIQIVRQASEHVMNQLRFPKLTEITGHLLVSLVYGQRSLKDIFPNLAVIRGREVFLDYSLVIYENDGLREINLPSLTTILDGGVRIEKNINLCYVRTIRWESIMRSNAEDEYSVVLRSNNNDCYDACYQAPGGQKKCTPPAGHGSLRIQRCWAPGNSRNPECQSLCDKLKCGEKGCLKGRSDLCCHKECLGGCFSWNSPRHCYACRHLRQMPSGECVEKCLSHLFEIDNFKCEATCPSNYYKLEIPGESKKCVKVCPAGYQKEGQSDSLFGSPPKLKCVKCKAVKCPRVCTTANPSTPDSDEKPPIESLASLALYEGCTEIKGNLIINIKGSGGSGIATKLEENLGKIEKVSGYIVIRESTSLTSLNFLKNLKEIEPRGKPILKPPFGFKPDLYNDRYALAILDNPKLEAMWPFQQNLSISDGGIMVHLNPYLCPSKINPLVDDILKWNRSDTSRKIDISDTTNGNAVACNVRTINVTLEEIDRPPGRIRCNPVCMKVEWDEVVISDDYRNVLFYTVSYREAPNRKITEYDDRDACSKESNYVWTRVDHVVETPEVNVSLSSFSAKPRKLVKYIQKLKPFTLYAFQVEAVVLKNEGAKSDLVFIETKENVPSVPVGLEANYISSSALLVKWQPPLFPNGNITKYIVKYDLSAYSPWEQDLDWCNRQVFVSRREDKDNTDKGNGDKNPDGSCRNITCDCDKDKKEEEKPEKLAALFAKEFQDKLYRTIFTKDNDDKEPPTNKSILPTTTPTAYYNQSNCSNNAQNPLCRLSTVSASGKTTTSSNGSTTTAKTTSAKPTVTVRTAKPFSNVTLVVKGTENSVTLRKLKHFTDYKITVCACTKVGCATGTSCAVRKGMTNKKNYADNLGGPLKVTADNSTREFYLRWDPPKDPNGVVLKYDVEIRQDDNPALIHCRRGNENYYRDRVSLNVYGNYSARVRAITPAGNGSWSRAVFFSMKLKEETTDPPVEETDAFPLGTVVGSSIAASVVFVLACGFFVWYIARKRYKRYSDEQIPGVLYASVNPEYMTSTDVYIPDEWEFPREKIKLVRELGNGSFGMVYEGEAEDITPNVPCCRVAVKTVSENASIRDRVEFLQEASVMKEFSSNHVVRLLGVVSEGQPTLVIMELMEHGDLKNFLRSRRPGEGSLPAPTLQELLQMAGEIADGMAYLAARKYVHRDLAARNCMVNADFTVKIGDFGMTRDIYETDYYRKGGKGLLPVRWMAPESLKDGVFTSNSDVWSFGVVVWEMATLACQPYPGKSNEEVLKYVVDGGLMEKPEECPDRLYEMMALCWQYSAKARPTFVYLISLLEADLSDTFRERSFYHTLSEDQLKGLLTSHYKHKNRSETADSSLNVESAA